MTTTLPLRTAAADGFVLSWALYIAADPGAVLGEAARVLKPGGWIVLATPLVFPPTPEPTDYWRFTADALRLLLQSAGFESVTVYPLGDRWSSAAYLLEPYLRPRPIVGHAIGTLAFLMDRTTYRFRKRPRPCPIGYVTIAKRAGRRPL